MAWALTPLTEDQREIQRLAHDFAEHEIAPYSAQWDRDAYFEPALVQAKKVTRLSPSPSLKRAISKGDACRSAREKPPRVPCHDAFENPH